MAFAGGDFASWWQKTPYNNEIGFENHAGYELVINCKQTDPKTIHNLSSWYFYKGHILGTIKEQNQTIYFILNEETCALEMVLGDAEFEQKLELRHLKPIIWTRWYTENWGILWTTRESPFLNYSDDLKKVSTLLFFSALIILFFRTKFAMTRFIILAIIGSLSMIIFLDIVPTSI